LEHVPNGSVDDDRPTAGQAHSNTLGIWRRQRQLTALPRYTGLTTDDRHMLAIAVSHENVARHAQDAFDRGRDNAPWVASTTEHVVLEGPWETAKCGQAGLREQSRKESADCTFTARRGTRVIYENVTPAQNWERLKGLKIIPEDRDK